VLPAGIRATLPGLVLRPVVAPMVKRELPGDGRRPALVISRRAFVKAIRAYDWPVAASQEIEGYAPAELA